MLRTCELLREKVGYDQLPPPPQLLKAGLSFDIRRALQDDALTVEGYDAHFVTSTTVARRVNLVSRSRQLELHFLVSSSSCEEARQQLLGTTLLRSSMPLDFYARGPADIGELSIWMGPSSHFVLFVRHNVLVEVEAGKRTGDFLSIARRIDEALVALPSNAPEQLEELAPQITKIKGAREGIATHSAFYLEILHRPLAGSAQPLYGFEYDRAAIELHSLRRGLATFTARRAGEFEIDCLLADTRSLLSDHEQVVVKVGPRSSAVR